MQGNLVSKEEEFQVLPRSWPSVMAMVCGACMHLSFILGGELFVGELLFVALLPFFIFDRFFIHRSECRQQVWLWKPVSFLICSLFITSAGYVISDLYRNNDPGDYLRGWARLAFLGIDILAVAFFISIRILNMWYLVLGYATLGLVIIALKGTPIDSSHWKFGYDWSIGYGYPFVLTIMAILCLMGKGSAYWRGAILISLMAVNIVMDYRSLGVFCFVVALMGWIYRASLQGSGRLAFLGVQSLVVSLLLVVAYNSSQSNFEQRRQASNSIRLSSAMVGINAIIESPFIGYGSWSRDARFAKQLADLQFRMSKTQENPLYDFDLIRHASLAAHSQLIESWNEGGMLGIIFFLCYFLVMVRGLNALTFRRHNEKLDPMLSMFIVWAMWALFMSPFKGLTRLDIAFACISSIIAIYRADKHVET